MLSGYVCDSEPVMGVVQVISMKLACCSGQRVAVSVLAGHWWSCCCLVWVAVRMQEGLHWCWLVAVRQTRQMDGFPEKVEIRS